MLQPVTAIYGVARGGKRGYPGTIGAIHPDGMYTVHYNDGDVEQVHARHITAAKRKLHENTSPEERRKKQKNN